ncbi:hypothetical protein CEXT_256211 [Caerostris extrusa]|uniref:Uncharacterized protein n=1 Tax=Caerostris extrusa TaxID=172846 RepID=A0AAV4ULU7_CAEEX|nr:hypothetical protein CEXT_256211 [Caerostris extrusa]
MPSNKRNDLKNCGMSKYSWCVAGCKKAATAIIAKKPSGKIPKRKQVTRVNWMNYWFKRISSGAFSLSPVLPTTAIVSDPFNFLRPQLWNVRSSDFLKV